jgi:hypothetical protein
MQICRDPVNQVSTSWLDFLALLKQNALIVSESEMSRASLPAGTERVFLESRALHVEFMASGTSQVDAYCDALRRLRVDIRRKRRRHLLSNISAWQCKPTLSTSDTKELLQPHRWELWDRPSCCPGLALSGNNLFGPLWQRLRFLRFASKCEVEWLFVNGCECCAGFLSWHIV